MNKIGFWGYPAPDVIRDLQIKYPDCEWVDLDVDLGAPEIGIIPDAYCKIIKNIINNSFALKDELIKIVAPIGKDKCDSGWFAAQILKDNDFKVIETKFERVDCRKELVISTSNMPLFDKVNTIMNNIIPDNFTKTAQVQKCKPEFGFWGVPPNDLELLKIFPDTTHIYGWTRCVEAGVPADIELEMFVDENVPTVFYAQAFCAKCQLAKYLADKYNGLYIDIDDTASNSVRAKVEAFIRLR